MADYVTLPEVLGELSDLGHDYDALLQQKITRASRAIDRKTKRPYGFGLTSGITLLFDGTGTRKLFVPDLSAVTSVSVKVGGTWQTSYTAVPAGDIFLEPFDRRPGHPALWIELTDYPHSQVLMFDMGKATVQVVGDFGWPAVPDDIKDVCLEIVTRSWRQRSSGQKDETGSDNLDMATIPRGMSKQSRDILDEYTYYRNAIFV